MAKKQAQPDPDPDQQQAAAGGAPHKPSNSKSARKGRRRRKRRQRDNAHQLWPHLTHVPVEVGEHGERIPDLHGRARLYKPQKFAWTPRELSGTDESGESAAALLQHINTLGLPGDAGKFCSQLAAVHSARSLPY